MLFANFAEAMAEGRGKAQADTLRKTRADTVANVRRPDGTMVEVPATELQVGDECVVVAGEMIPGDGEVIEGIASVDESAITGESAPVIRESGGDRSAVTGGTRVLSDRIVVRITAKPGETFLDRMIALVEGASRQKTPNEIALNILLSGLTIIFLLATVTLQPFAIYSGGRADDRGAGGPAGLPDPDHHRRPAVGHRHRRHGPPGAAQRAGHVGPGGGGRRRLLHAAAGQDRHHHPRQPPGRRVRPHARRRARPSWPRPPSCRRLADETPEGRSIVVLAKEQYGLEARDLPGAELVPFTAQTRMSGVDFEGRPDPQGRGRLGQAYVLARAGTVPAELDAARREHRHAGRHAAGGGRRTRGASGSSTSRTSSSRASRERFDELRAMGIRTVMITGDNPLTAAAIAEEAGVDDFLAEATPEDKMALIRKEQAGGHLVAMTGDGTNDAPALAQADVGVAMNTGTQAAKEAGNMVDLDSNPTKLIEIVEIGKQLLITRGSLTTFSIANDVAKYFAIIPAMFEGVFPALKTLNIMQLASPHSAILSAVIFNALIIVALIPLALRGVKFRAAGAAAVLRRNILIYGLGGLIAPFVGIKLIDLVITALGVK